MPVRAYYGRFEELTRTRKRTLLNVTARKLGILMMTKYTAVTKKHTTVMMKHTAVIMKRNSR